ncbi:hypothetical protein [Nubsella zeaxanthinifaciens]|uniref:hypothetical protein n=1 Tax=Nubsella zeaxanthinifaciens TaxID=392412 RepID=UPI000DE51742|nr:hypothetical protein [Nubsella zeaxanthinifaciens]
MAQFEDKILEALAKYIKMEVGDQVFEGVVTSVDDVDFVADVKLDNQGGDLFDVRLKAVAGAVKSIEVLPKLGAEVVLVKIVEEEYLIVACSEIEKYKVSVGDASLTITNQGFEIKRGNESLDSILKEIVAQMLKIYAPKDVAGITAITPRINQLFNSN